MQTGHMVNWVGNGALDDFAVKLPRGVVMPPAPPSAPPAPPRPRWPARRVAAVQALWGGGFTGPGGAAETVKLAGPLGLNSDASLLLLGGGLGGPAETIVANFGSWVASFEADATLADLAAQRLASHPAARRLQIATWDPARPSFGLHNAHHAMALEAARGGKLSAMLDGMAAALRPHGRVVMTELVTEAPAPANDREFAAWCRLENRQPDMPRVDQVTTGLARLGFDVRVVEDVSDRHVSATLAAWRAAVKSMAAGPKPDTAAASAFVNEAELWLLRIRLMRRLGLRLVRWYAVGSA
jgi:cyclopropane fatty-acyl-phospholipid synthase-like methyltransferase